MPRSAGSLQSSTFAAYVMPLCTPSAALVSPVLLTPAATRTYRFTASTGTEYVFISSVMPAAAAERACVDIGGHLASYPTLLEQAETEQVHGHIVLAQTMHGTCWTESLAWLQVFQPCLAAPHAYSSFAAHIESALHYRTVHNHQKGAWNDSGGLCCPRSTTSASRRCCPRSTRATGWASLQRPGQSLCGATRPQVWPMLQLLLARHLLLLLPSPAMQNMYCSRCSVVTSLLNAC